jgi:hypothetical protein
MSSYSSLKYAFDYIYHRLNFVMYVVVFVNSIKVEI